jgi:L,D-transpeptidase catalytic domain
MSVPKIFSFVALAAFGVVAVLAIIRHNEEQRDEEIVAAPVIEASQEVVLPRGDRMEEFFNTGLPRLPFVETIPYSAKVPWLPGKAAWVEQYASHYGTSRHMIARSRNGEPNYEGQEVANGDRFNVYREDRPVSFHLVVDLGRAHMWAYAFDEVEGKRVLVKDCPVGVGRPDSKRASGYLTPLGTYSLGERVAVYRPGTMGLYNKERQEMVRVFGTRWIPFDEELEDCTAPSRGLGLHGCPLVADGSGGMVEDRSGLGEYESDGCIRVATDEMEELFAVMITKPAQIHIVDDFFDAQLPGVEE